MEGRRVEGVFLDTAILRNRAHEAYETVKILELKVLSRVPEAFLTSLLEHGSSLRAKLKAYDQSRLIVELENGFEVEAENRLSVPLEPGEELYLRVVSKEPLVLRVEGSSLGIRGIGELLGKGLELSVRLSPEGFREGIESSGLLYERRVWDFLRGRLGLEALSKDQKYLLLKMLEDADTSEVERSFRSLQLPEDLRPSVNNLLQRLERGDKVGFLIGIPELEEAIGRAVSSRERWLGTLRELVGSVVRTIVENTLRALEEAGVRVKVREDLLSSMRESPRSLDVFREAVKSLGEGRTSEFLQRLYLLGIEVQDPESVYGQVQKLLRTLSRLIEGAESSLLSSLEVSDLKELLSKQRRTIRELEELREAMRSLEEVPKQVKESLKHLQTIGMLQHYLLVNEGRRFLVPFEVGEERGILGFSLKDSYRIFVRLEIGGGFLGIVLEAPRSEKPEFVHIVFRTNLGWLAEAIRREERRLREELDSLGIKVRRLEVLEDREGEFEMEMVDEFGGRGTLSLRV